MRWINEIRTALILLTLQMGNAKTNKNTAPAVFEVINEQARIEDKKILPYENPLAGNLQNNVKMHAQHQQAMFNAEKVRQHRAQIQRWNNQPPKQNVDSYMKAYQESQENHQLALEQLQSNTKERKVRTRPEQRRNLKERPQLEPSKITRADAFTNNRNHRSFGSVHNYVQKKRIIHTYPAYNLGVTIKPHGNIGLADHKTLYTTAVPSKAHYDHPKQYGQAFNTVNDIQVLNALYPTIKPQEHLTKLSHLIHTEQQSELGTDTLNTPIDLYFYLNDPKLTNGQSIATYPGSYASRYVHKDHTPITEEVDDVKDNRDPRIYLQPKAPTSTTPRLEVTTQKTVFFKPEVKPTVQGSIEQKEILFTSYKQPSYDTIKYVSPLQNYQKPSTEGIKYLKSQPTGVQHLNQDGTGVSAYGDDDIQYAAKYEFGYRVRDHESGNDFGHQETTFGDKTRGEYHVLLPDGRLQQVKYSAGPEGFHANISYDHSQ